MLIHNHAGFPFRCLEKCLMDLWLGWLNSLRHQKTVHFFSSLPLSNKWVFCYVTQLRVGLTELMTGPGSSRDSTSRGSLPTEAGR